MFKGPHMLHKPRVLEGLTTISFEFKLHHPWIILVRICTISNPVPSKIKNVRIQKIDQNTILIAWMENQYINNKRCTQTYEILYTNQIEEDKQQWRSITQNKHIPYLSFVFQTSEPLQGMIPI